VREFALGHREMVELMMSSARKQADKAKPWLCGISFGFFEVS